MLFFRKQRLGCTIKVIFFGSCVTSGRIEITSSTFAGGTRVYGVFTVSFGCEKESLRIHTTIYVIVVYSTSFEKLHEGVY
jgi:hypothetical protein